MTKRDFDVKIFDVAWNETRSFARKLNYFRFSLDKWLNLWYNIYCRLKRRRHSLYLWISPWQAIVKMLKYLMPLICGAWSLKTEHCPCQRQLRMVVILYVFFEPYQTWFLNLLCRFKYILFSESLILAQDERWRRA